MSREEDNTDLRPPTQLVFDVLNDSLHLTDEATLNQLWDDRVELTVTAQSVLTEAPRYICTAK
jgi:hypothetical protein